MHLLTVVSSFVAVANADTLLVPSEYTTIQAAMTAAQVGDTVLVADGIYTGEGNTNLTFAEKGFILRSQNGPKNCIIDGGGISVPFVFVGEPPESVVDGFTITNGGGYPGGGMYLYYNSNPTIRNCIITGNTTGQKGGGGLYLALANPTLTNCLIANNSAGAGVGGDVYCTMSSPTMSNCTIVGNTANGLGGGIYCADGSIPTIRNSILWGNSPGEIYVDSFSGVEVSYSDVQDGWLGTGNIDTDPGFVDPSQEDYHALSGSPCTDAGDNTSVPAGVLTDLDGNARFDDDPSAPNTGNPDGVNEIVDMGAYEFQVLGTPIPAVSEWGICLMILLPLTAGTLGLGARRSGQRARTTMP